MTERLKADLHLHVGDDPCDMIVYSAEMLIDAAAQLNFDVLAITPHNRRFHSPRLTEYACRRGILLMPGVEILCEGSHVLILNPDKEQAAARTFSELRSLGRRNAAIVAPHPFYPAPRCLWGHLRQNIDLFDAIEYTSLYYRWLNPNRRAEVAARKHGLPLIGCSDTHTMPYCDSTFTWVEGERTVEGVIDAVRKGQVEVETRPRPPKQAIAMTCYVAGDMIRELLGVGNLKRSA